MVSTINATVTTILIIFIATIITIITNNKGDMVADRHGILHILW